MTQKENRFKRLAGLFDSPIIGPTKDNSLEKKQLKKWPEDMTKRFEAIHLIRKELKYFGTDFETWARDQFGVDSEQYTEAIKLARKLSKSEAILYNILNMMTEMAKTGEVSLEKAADFENDFVKLAEAAGFEIGSSLEVKAECLPGCTCPSGAHCPSDPLCDTCRSCQQARLDNKTEKETNHPADMAHKEAGIPGCPTCGFVEEPAPPPQCPTCGHAEEIQAAEEMDMAMGDHVETNCVCKPEDSCPNSKNCRYCPACQEQIVAAKETTFDYDLDYTVSTDANGTSWRATINGNVYASMEEAEADLMNILTDAMAKMDLEDSGVTDDESEESVLPTEDLTDLDEGKESDNPDAKPEEPKEETEEEKSDNPFEKSDDSDDKDDDSEDDEDEEEEKEASGDHFQQENAFQQDSSGQTQMRQAQRTMDEGSPHGTWTDVKCSVGVDKLKALETAFEEKGIFAQPIMKGKEQFVRVFNSSKDINQIISDVFKSHNVRIQ